MTNTERPDAIAGAILEGKVAVLVDGTPFALIAPSPSSNCFNRVKTTTKSSISRPFAAVAHHFLYGIDASPFTIYCYLHVSSRNAANDLADQPCGQREGIPFPAVVEALAMEITFEVLGKPVFVCQERWAPRSPS